MTDTKMPPDHEENAPRGYACTCAACAYPNEYKAGYRAGLEEAIAWLRQNAGPASILWGRGDKADHLNRAADALERDFADVLRREG